MQREIKFKIWTCDICKRSIKYDSDYEHPEGWGIFIGYNNKGKAVCDKHEAVWQLFIDGEIVRTCPLVRAEKPEKTRKFNE